MWTSLFLLVRHKQIQNIWTTNNCHRLSCPVCFPTSSSSPSSSSLLPWACLTSQLSKQMLRSLRLCNEAWQVLSASSPLSRLMPSSAQTSQSTIEPSVCSSWLESRCAPNNQCYGSWWALTLNKWVINTSFCLQLWVKSARWASVSERDREREEKSHFFRVYESLKCLCCTFCALQNCFLNFCANKGFKLD